MQTRSKIAFAIALAACTLGRAWGAAGPPLVTDDPGTPGDKNWEINLALTADASAANESYGIPLADMNYGWGDRIQLKYQIPWSLMRSEQNQLVSDTQVGFDRSQAGVKWRFEDKAPGRPALSTYPQITFPSPVPGGLRDSLAGKGSDFFLPLELEESTGHWDFNQEIGLNWVGENRNQYALGLVLTYYATPTSLILGEIHETALDDLSDHELLANVGTVFALNSFSNLLFAIGQSFHSIGGGPNRLLLYVGWQLHL